MQTTRSTPVQVVFNSKGELIAIRVPKDLSISRGREAPMPQAPTGFIAWGDQRVEEVLLNDEHLRVVQTSGAKALIDKYEIAAAGSGFVLKLRS